MKRILCSRIVLLFFGPVLFILFWQAVVFLKFVNPLFLPPPFETAKTLAMLLWPSSAQTILPDAIASLYRLAASFSLSAAIGVPSGLFLGYFKKLQYSTQLAIDFFRSVPATALLPLFALVFGIFDESKIFLAAFSSSLVIIVNVIYGVKSVPKQRILAAKSFGASKLMLLSEVVLPSSLPSIFAGLRIAVSLALIVVIVSEMLLGASHGLGNRIQDAATTYSIPEMYAAIIVAGAIGFCINLLFLKIEKKQLKWVGK